jgi:hypothetical protein
MDKCEFSEFSYGYCLTEDLIVGKGTPFTAAPIFPSLQDEGKPGVGYDMRLNRPGTQLFLQFKLVHQMVRGTANEEQKGHFVVPFYRMHLRPRNISDQHESLLSLENSGNDVFYAAPGFHTAAALTVNYTKRLVWNRSFRLRPSAIGSLKDDKNHHVTFKTYNGKWRFYSERPSKEGHAPDTEEIAESLRQKIADRGNRNLRNQIQELDATLLDIMHTRNAQRHERERVPISELGEQVDPIQRVAYIARQFFDCQLFFVTLKTQNEVTIAP